MTNPNASAFASSVPLSTSSVLSWLGSPMPSASASANGIDAAPRTPLTSSKFSWTESSPSESLRSGSGFSPRGNAGSPHSKAMSLSQGHSKYSYSYTPSPRTVQLHSDQFQSWTFGTAAAAGVNADPPETPTRAVSLTRTQDVLVSPKTKVPMHLPTYGTAVPRPTGTEHGIDVLESHFEFDDDDSEDGQENEHRLSLFTQPRILSMVNNATSNFPLLRRTKGPTKVGADEGVSAIPGDSESSLFTRRPWKRTASSSSSTSSSPPQRGHKRNASSTSVAFLRRRGARGGGTTPDLSFSSSASAASDSVDSLCSMLGKCAPAPTPATQTPLVVGEIDVKMDESPRTTIAPWLAHEAEHFAPHAAVNQATRGHQRQVSEPQYGVATPVTKATTTRPVLPYDPARRPRLTTHQRHRSHHDKPLPRRPDPLSPSSSAALQRAIAAAKSPTDGSGVTMPLRIPGKVL